MSRLFAANRSRVLNSVRRRNILLIEVLEDRSLMAAAVVYTPAQMMSAYGLTSNLFGSANGAGQTIAIVDAYNAPNISSDLQKFDTQFGISSTDGNGNSALSIAYTKGSQVSAKAPAYDAGWSQEITLDVEWAHAIAPGAHILLVEAASSSLTDLFGAVSYASQHASVVSMSWGANEFAGETAYDSYFSASTVSFVASSGDTGAIPIYPAVSPNVLGVGGTSLNSLVHSGPTSETGWSDSGGGVSAYESQPAYQSGVTPRSTKRTSPDVAYDADPYTGVYVYWTASGARNGGWYAFGGTSAGAPQWSALVAIADQGRGNLGPIGNQLLPAIYSGSATDFNDITLGSTSITVGRGRNATTTTDTAGPGYDLVTGLGTPKADAVVQYLAAWTGATQALAHPAGAPKGGAVGGALLADTSFLVIGIQSGVSATTHGSNDAASVNGVFAPTLGPTAAPTTTFYLPPNPVLPHAWNAAPARTVDTPRSEPFAPGFTPPADEYAEPGEVPTDPNFDNMFRFDGVSAAPLNQSIANPLEPVAAAEALPAPTLIGEPAAGSAAPSQGEPAQSEERGTLATVVTKSIVNLVGLASVAAYFACGVFVDSSKRVKLRRDKSERELA